MGLSGQIRIEGFHLASGHPRDSSLTPDSGVLSSIDGGARSRTHQSTNPGACSCNSSDCTGRGSRLEPGEQRTGCDGSHGSLPSGSR